MQVARRSRLSARAEGRPARFRQKALDHSPVDGEEEWTRRAMQGAQQPGPRGELVGALDRGREASPAVAVLDGRPNGDDV
jgi:hypothetical protein